MLGQLVRNISSKEVHGVNVDIDDDTVVQSDAEMVIVTGVDRLWNHLIRTKLLGWKKLSEPNQNLF